MATNSFYEKFLNDLALAMRQDPGPQGDPMQRLLMTRGVGNPRDYARMAGRRREMAIGSEAPTGEDMGWAEFLAGLGKVGAGAASAAVIGNPNPIQGIRDILGPYADAKNRVMEPGGSRLEEGVNFMWPKALAMRHRPGHGAEIREDLLARRKQLGPRKGSGRAAKPKYPPENNGDLIAMLAQSVAAPAAAPKKSGLLGMLGRLRRAEK